MKILSYYKGYYIPVFIFFFFIIVYSMTMVQGLGGRINFGDSIKWQYLYIVNGIPHAPGYPQFLVLTELFSRIIFFLPEPERITFISVFFGALAMSVFYLLVLLLTESKWGSIFPTVFFGFTFTFWCQATEAEVYTLNIFYLVTVFYLYIKFFTTKSNNYFLMACGLYAFSFGNHLSMITILPAVIFITFATGYKFVLKPSNIFWIGVMISASASQYLFLYFRGNGGHISSIISEMPLHPTVFQVYTYVLGSTGSMLSFGLKEILTERIVLMFAFLNENFNVLGLVLAVSGFSFYLFLKKGIIVPIFLSIALIGQIVFAITYDVPDAVVFFLPVFLIVGIFISFLILHTNKLMFRSVFVILTVLNIYYFDGLNKIKIHTFYPYSLINSIFSIYEGFDFPLYYPGAANYNHITFFNYLRFSNRNGKASNVVLHESKINSLKQFYILGEHYWLYKDTSRYQTTLVKQLNVTDYVKSNVQNNKAVFIASMDDATSNMPVSFKEYIKELGGTIHQLGFRGSYAAVIYKNRICDQVNNEGPCEISSNTLQCEPLNLDLEYRVLSGGKNFGNYLNFEVKRGQYGVQYTGLNVLIFDVERDEVLEVMSFNTSGGELKELYLVTRK